MNNIIVFMFLALAHFLYDFHWQGPYIAEMKGKCDFHLFVHALTWTLLICTILYFCQGLFFWNFLFLLITHFFIDRFKARSQNQSKLVYLILDQVCHILTIIFVILF